MDLGIKGKIALVTAASRGLGRGCAQQLAADRCRVAICSRDETAAKKAAKEVYQKMMDSIPCKTIGDPADFGAAAAFLVGTRARYITGQNLLIDGGKYGGLL